MNGFVLRRCRGLSSVDFALLLPLPGETLLAGY